MTRRSRRRRLRRARWCGSAEPRRTTRRTAARRPAAARVTSAIRTTWTRLRDSAVTTPAMLRSDGTLGQRERVSGDRPHRFRQPARARARGLRRAGLHVRGGGHLDRRRPAATAGSSYSRSPRRGAPACGTRCCRRSPRRLQRPAGRAASRRARSARNCTPWSSRRAPATTRSRRSRSASWVPMARAGSCAA